MASKRAKQLVARLLSEADAALEASDWPKLRDRALNVLAIDGRDADGRAYLATADIHLGNTAEWQAENRRKFAIDDQTGKAFALRPEDGVAVFAATLSGAYLLTALGFFIWMLVDTWSGRNYLLDKLGYGGDVFGGDTYRLLAFVAIAGALAAIIDSFRSLISWHLERKAYGPSFLLKDIAMPWIGGTIAVFVYVAIRAGTGLLNGDANLSAAGTVPVLSAFSIASLAGFSSRKVFKWLDDRASKIFSVNDTRQRAVPNLLGRTLAEAEDTLSLLQLRAGTRGEETRPGGDAMIGKVTAQDPPGGSVVSGQAAVDITVAIKAAGPGNEEAATKAADVPAVVVES